MPPAQREVLSVGIDVGTTTTQVVFSRLVLHDVARPGQVPRIQVDEKSVVHHGDIHTTPLSAPDEVDAEALTDLIRREYEAAAVSPGSIETGAVAEYSPATAGFGGGRVASCARATAGIARLESPAAVDVRKRRRLRAARIYQECNRRRGPEAAGAAP